MAVNILVPTPKIVKVSVELSHGCFVNPVIPLEGPMRKEHMKYQSMSFKLRSTSTNKGSTNYELTVPYFSSGSPKELLMFIHNLQKVITGQNIMTGPEMFALMHRLLHGDALSAFNHASVMNSNENIRNY